MNELMKIEGLTFEYPDGYRALDHIDLDIYSGEKLAVLGANGAGKSTLFLNMNGIHSPTSGRILLEGKPVTYDKKGLIHLRKNVGIVFQDPDNQIFASTVYGEVSFGALNLGYSKEEARERTLKALEYMNILDLKDRPPHYLSGGQKKMVSIANILVMDPKLIIFDEPTAALDPVNAENLEMILKKISDEGRTVVLSTHDVDFAYRWADRIAVFSKSRLCAVGTPEEVFGNDELLEQANLKKPAVYEIYEALKAKGITGKSTGCPKDVEALKSIIYGHVS